MGHWRQVCGEQTEALKGQLVAYCNSTWNNVVSPAPQNAGSLLHNPEWLLIRQLPIAIEVLLILFCLEWGAMWSQESPAVILIIFRWLNLCAQSAAPPMHFGIDFRRLTRKKSLRSAKVWYKVPPGLLKLYQWACFLSSSTSITMLGEMINAGQTRRGYVEPCAFIAYLVVSRAKTLSVYFTWPLLKGR